MFLHCRYINARAQASASWFDNAREGKKTLARKHGHLRVLLLSASESGRRFGSVFHHHYSKSQPLSVGIFFARSPSKNRNDVASVASWEERFSVRFTQIPLSVISRDASARDPTLFIFNDLQAAGSISNLVGRWGIGKRIGTVCQNSRWFDLINHGQCSGPVVMPFGLCLRRIPARCPARDECRGSACAA